MTRLVTITPPPAPLPCPGLDKIAGGHVAGPNARSSMTFLGLLLYFATRNTRQAAEKSSRRGPR